MSVLKIKDANGTWQDIPAIKGATGSQGPTGPQGPKGDKGDPGLTQQEVQDLIDASIEELGELGFTPTVVETLPVTDIDTHTIYLVPKTGEAGDVYDEYVYINNAWEHIGNTAVDLSNYYTKGYIDDELEKRGAKIYEITVPVNLNSLTDSGIWVSDANALATANKILTALANQGGGTCLLLVHFNGWDDSYNEDILFTNSNIYYYTKNRWGGACTFYTNYLGKTSFKNDFNTYSYDLIFQLGDGSWDTNGNSTTSTLYVGRNNDRLVRTRDVLTRDNTSSYTPTGDYNPATKKYVDDAVAGAGGGSSMDMVPIYSFKVTVSNPNLNTAMSLYTADRTALTSIINDAYSNGNDLFGLSIEFTNSSAAWIDMPILNNAFQSMKLQSKPTNISLLGITNDSIPSDYSLGYIGYINLTISITWNDDVATVTSGVLTLTSKQYLNTTNTVSYTPTANYHPATKKYVDDSIATAVGDINTILATLTTPQGGE